MGTNGVRVKFTFIDQLTVSSPCC